MSDETISPVARAILGGVDAPDREVPCLACGTMTACPGFIWEAVKTWNREECRLLEASGAVNIKPDLIKSDELVTCDACLGPERERRRHEYQVELNTTAVYLRQLRAGVYNPESLAWLRKHGHAADVIRILSEEGNKSA